MDHLMRSDQLAAGLANQAAQAAATFIETVRPLCRVDYSIIEAAIELLSAQGDLPNPVKSEAIAALIVLSGESSTFG
jgi:hypothetical protein